MKHVRKLLGIMMLLLVVMTGAAAAATDVLTITSQPVNKSVVAGSTVKFAVTAETPATSINYQWQYRKDASSAWAPSAQSGNKTATLYVSATAGLNGYQFRCMVKDSNGSTVYSDAATLNIIPKITTQPVSKTVAPGATATFTVAATGTGTLTYQWQYRKDSASSWASSAQSGNKTDTLSVAATNGLHGYQFRCVITDGNGQKSYSSAVTLSISPRITVQPANKSVTAGSTATFSVTAAGTATLTYQWQFRKDASSSWAASGQSGNKTATLSVAATAGLNGYQFRCVITDGSGRKAYTGAATLYIIPKITTQPASTTVSPGSKVTFTAAATGTGTLTYQWQYRTDSNSAWAAFGQSGNKTATLSVTASAALHGYQFRCVITDGNGQKAYTSAATLTVSPRITVQPEDKCASLGTAATFSVTAAGTGTLTYQWQYRKNAVSSWANSGQNGNKTAKLSVSTTASLQGYQFRCKITDGSGRVSYTKVVTLTLCDIPIDETYFPDELFREVVSARYDKDKDGKLSASEIASVDDINLTGRGVGSIKGIEFFTEVTGFSCGNCNVTSLDISRNTALQRFYCYENNLTSLDVRNNPELTLLSCFGNSITSLDVSNNTKLTNLYCYDNNLTSLDVSKNTALKFFNCKNNKISSLDVTKNTALTSLNVLGNNLTSLNVSKNTALTELVVAENKLTSIDVSKNTALTYFSCYDNNLTSVNVTNNTALTQFYCQINKLSSLDVSKNTALKYLYCRNNNLSSLDVSNNTALTNLNALGNNLTSINVSNNTALVELFVSDNKLTSIDVSNNTALKYFYCSGNSGLTSLNLSQNTALEELYCYENKLTSLDVTCNTALKVLSCYGNSLTSLNLSKNTALTGLYCQNNKLTSLDVTRNTALTALRCYNNSLTSIDVSRNKALVYFHCYNNKLKKLDLSKNTELLYLYCYGNSLTSLDLSKNTKLYRLYCNNNNLTSLILNKGGNENKLIDCSNNNLTSIDLTDIVLCSFDCSNNRLTSLNLDKTQVEMLYCYGNNISEVILNRAATDRICRCYVSPGTKVTAKNGEVRVLYISQ